MQEKIEASEVFNLIMKNFFESDFKKIIAELITKDSRNLSELSIWILMRRGFTSTQIPKMSA